MAEKVSNERAKELERNQEVEPEERMELVDVGAVAQESDTTLYAEAPGSDVSQDEIVEDADNPASWLQYAGNIEQNGYTPADLLGPEDVGDLGLEYVLETDSAGLQTNPIVVPSDGDEPPVMYFTQNNQVVQAVNARTGEPFWEFRYGLQRNAAREVIRGVSVWQDKVYLGTGDVHLVALDRYTGEVEWVTDFLNDEQKELPIADERISHTAAPVIYDGTVLVGQAGDNVGWTTISGLDAESGELLWQHNTSPPEEWVGETWKYSSGAAWMGPSVDAENGLALFATGNPMPVANGVVRPGPNKHTNSIIAIDIESGEFEWVHQLYPHEVWDYDAHTIPYVFDMEIDGETRRVVGHDSKTAWSFVLDAETGELLRRSDPWETQEHEFGSWPDSKFFNYPPKGEENAGRLAPHYTGATEWPPDTLSERTGLRYINTNGAQTGYYYDDWEFDPEEAGFLQSGGTTDPGEYDAELRVIGLDLDSGSVETEYVFDDADGKVWGPGVTATGGGLVFSGSPEGQLVALDDESLEEQWQFDVGERMTSAPVVWDDPEIEQQYMAVSVNDRVFVFTAPPSDDAPWGFNLEEREDNEMPEREPRNNPVEDDDDEDGGEGAGAHSDDGDDGGNGNESENGDDM